MIIVQTFSAAIPGAAPADLAAVGEPEGFRSLLRPTLECQAGILGVSAVKLRSTGGRTVSEFDSAANAPYAGEVFTDGTAICVLALRPRPQQTHPDQRRRTRESASSANLVMHYIGPPGHAAVGQTVVAAVHKAYGVALQPVSYRSPRFEELKAEGREPSTPPTDQERTATSVLRDRVTRSVMVAVKTSGGLLVRDLARQIPQEERERTDSIRTRLRDAALIDSEVVVICGKSQAQTARVASRELLVEASNRGLRCACGKPIADERIEEALTVTEFGRTMLDKSRWLTLLVAEQLNALGVSSENILVEQQVGGDEVDCLANVRGELVLFELKDKEFNLGSAYSFGAKIGILRPPYAIIVTTEHVGGDAKEHFQRARLAQSSYTQRYWVDEPTTEIQYIEGIDDLASRVAEAIGTIYVRHAARVLEQVLPLAFPNARTMVDALLSRSRDVGASGAA